MQILYFSRRINLGSIESDTTISENESQLINEYSKNIDMHDIGFLFWQLTLKTIDDLKIIGNEAYLEMFIMQLIHLKNVDDKKENLESGDHSEKDQFKKSTLIGQNTEDEKLENNLSSKIKNQLKNTNQVKTSPIKTTMATQLKKQKQTFKLLKI